MRKRRERTERRGIRRRADRIFRRRPRGARPRMLRCPRFGQGGGACCRASAVARPAALCVRRLQAAAVLGKGEVRGLRRSRAAFAWMRRFRVRSGARTGVGRPPAGDGRMGAESAAPADTWLPKCWGGLSMETDRAMPFCATSLELSSCGNPHATSQAAASALPTRSR